MAQYASNDRGTYEFAYAKADRCDLGCSAHDVDLLVGVLEGGFALLRICYVLGSELSKTRKMGM